MERIFQGLADAPLPPAITLVIGIVALIAGRQERGWGAVALRYERP